MNLLNQNTINEQERTQQVGLTDKDDPIINKVFNDFLAIQRIKKESIGTDPVAFAKRMNKEYENLEFRYAAIIIIGTALNQFLYSLYLRPGGKFGYRVLKNMYSMLRKKLGEIPVMKLPDVEGVFGGKGGGLLGLKQRINLVYRTVENPGFAAKAFGFYRDISDPTSKIGTVLNSARAAKILASLGGIVYYLISTNSGEDEKSKENLSTILKYEKGQYDPVKEWTFIGFEYLRMFILIEALWADMKIRPYLQPKRGAAQDPAANMAVILAGSIGMTLALNLAVKAGMVMLKRGYKVPSLKAARGMFQEAVTASLKSGIGRLSDDVILGCHKAVDDIFDNLGPKAKQQLEAVNLGGQGTNSLKQLLKNAITESVSTSDKRQPISIFNDLSKQLTDIIYPGGKPLAAVAGQKNISSDAIAGTVNELLISVFRGAGDGIDAALSKTARQNERNIRRAKGITREARLEAASFLRTDSGAGKLDWKDLAKYRREKYRDIVRDILNEWKGLDDDFSTYYYLSGASHSGRGLNAVAIVSKQSEDFIGALKPAAVNRTHFSRLKEAREQVLAKYNNRIEELNAQIANRVKELKSSKEVGVANIDKLENIPFSTYQSTQEFQLFVDGAYEDIFQNALKSFDDLGDSVRNKSLDDISKEIEDAKEVIKSEIIELTNKSRELTRNKKTKLETLSAEAEEVQQIQNQIDVVNNTKKALVEDFNFDKSVESFIRSVTSSEDNAAILREIIEDLVKSSDKFADDMKPSLLRDRIVELPGKVKIAILSGLFGAALVGYRGYKAFTGGKGSEEDPITVSSEPMIPLLNNNQVFSRILIGLTYRGKKEFAKFDDADIDTVLMRNFIKIAKSSGLFSFMDGKAKENILTSTILQAHKDKLGLSDALDKIRKVAHKDVSQLARNKVINRFLKNSKSDSSTEELSIRTIRALQAVLIQLALSSEGGKLDNYLNDRVPLAHKGNEKGAKKVTQIDEDMQQSVLNNIKNQVKRLGLDKIKTVKESFEYDYKNMSSIIRNMLLEYRALDNYNQYPYHSGIGTDQEPQKDFIEDWKDFELSIVRDESRMTAIELAKILVKDLELFGDVVDLVGKNQSVSTEILKKMKISQENKQ